MPIVTETELRTQLGTPRRGARVVVPAQARFTPAAADLVRAWDLELVGTGRDREPAAPRATSVPAPPLAAEDRPAWDRPGRFPVVLEGDRPTCTTCGTPVRDKPSHLTQVDATTFAPKTDARIRLRGRFDSLHALTLVTAARARADGWGALGDHLDTLAAYCRELLAAEYHGRPPGPVAVAGLDEATLHHASHHPEEAVGLPHLVPDAAHPEILHWLNLLRCQVREAEVLVLDAYPPGSSEVADALSRAVNRLSSAVYVLELRTAAQAGGAA
jgi:ethanolamine utilization cobalamin adenosyltransferase